MKYPETALQKQIITWSRYMSAKYPCLKYLNSSQNGVKFTNAKSGRNAKLAGMIKGVPDLNLIYFNGKYYGLWIELKIKPNTPSTEQGDYINYLNSQGHYAKVCYTYEEAISTITDYLNNKL